MYGETGNNTSYYAGFFIGDVYSSTGVYASSDARVKQNIKDFASATDIIIKLHPKQYEFRHDGNLKSLNFATGTHYGLIAQDVEKILPNLVKTSPLKTSVKPAPGSNEAAKEEVAIIDFKALNYTELIPIIIKGMQEQQTQIEKQQTQMQELSAKNADLQSQISDLKLLVSKGTITSLTGYLKQNIPNPATNNTVISYYIPDNTRYAQIKITDIKGSTIRTFNGAKGEGEINLKSGELPAGTYNYTLYMNNKTIDTKQMVITK